MAQDNSGESSQNAEEPSRDDEVQALNRSHVFGDISSRLIRQWIEEGRANYERQQREQGASRDPRDETPAEEPE